MAKDLNALLMEADQLIETKLASVKVIEEDEISKLAAQLTSTSSEEVKDYTLTEKLASSIAIVDTLLNLDQLVKIAAFEQKAKESGIDEEKVAEYFEKNAAPQFRSVLDLLA